MELIFRDKLDWFAVTIIFTNSKNIQKIKIQIFWKNKNKKTNTNQTHMSVFCPHCGNHLLLSNSTTRITVLGTTTTTTTNTTHTNHAEGESKRERDSEEDVSLSYYCVTCAYVFPIRGTVSSVIKVTQKKVDAVIDEDSWKSAQKTEGVGLSFVC